MSINSSPTRRCLLGFAAAGLSGALGWKANAAPRDDLALAQLARRELDRVGGQAEHHDRVGIVDFARSSNAARMHIVNLEAGDVTSLLVAHGRGSDPEHSGWVKRFSNLEGSNASSEGAYLTGPYYIGRHGRSMRLRGLDTSNCLAEARAIVVHAATYVDDAIARRTGVIGRSQGCFAVSPAHLDEVLASLGPGRLLLAGKYAL